MPQQDGQVGFGGRPFHIEPRGLSANALDRLACLADGSAPVSRSRRAATATSRRPSARASRSSSKARRSSVELTLGVLDDVPQLLAADAVAAQIVGTGDGPLLEVVAGVLETLNLRLRARWCVRPGRRAQPWPQPSAGPGSPPLRALRTAGAAPARVARPRPAARARCAGWIPAPRPDAPPGRSALLPPSGARRRPAPACARRARRNRRR